MIEFKAECGHTVRAKDQDAGKAVRCSYCGKASGVPDSQEDDLDFLFQEVDRSSVHPAIDAKPARRRSKPGAAKGRRKSGEFNPFTIAMKLGYAAVLVIIVVVVARTWVIPLFKPDGGPQAFTSTTPVVKKKRPAAARTLSRDQGGPSRSSLGLRSLRGHQGLYVSSTPQGADLFYIRKSDAPPRGRISRLQASRSGRTNLQLTQLGRETYVVEVALRWNDPTLNGYPGFWEFRRAIQYASESECKKRLEKYFLPDGADCVFVDKTEDQIYIVRQYRGVEVLEGRWTAVRALFLPKIARQDGFGFDIKEIIRLLPSTEEYTFDVGQVNDELAFHEVPATERFALRDALARIGAVPYMTPDRRIHLFKIGIEEGNFGQRVIE